MLWILPNLQPQRLFLHLTDMNKIVLWSCYSCDNFILYPVNWYLTSRDAVMSSLIVVLTMKLSKCIRWLHMAINRPEPLWGSKGEELSFTAHWPVLHSVTNVMSQHFKTCKFKTCVWKKLHVVNFYLNTGWRRQVTFMLRLIYLGERVPSIQS